MTIQRLSSVPLDIGVDEDRPLRTYLQGIFNALNGPAFFVHRNNVNQVGIVSGVVTKMQFNSVATIFQSTGFDSHAGFDLVTNFRYTVSVPGIYCFGTQCRFVAVVAGTSVVAQVLKNGASGIGNARSMAVGAVSPSALAVTLQPMTKGDYVEFTCFQDSGANQDLNGSPALTFGFGFKLPNLGWTP